MQWNVPFVLLSGMYLKSRKATITFVMSVERFVSPSVSQHGTTLRLDCSLKQLCQYKYIY